MLSYHLALQHVRDAAPRLPSESVDLTTASGRVLAADLSAPHAMPPFDQSLMDGYAVRSRDARAATTSQPVRLAIGPTLTAGETLQQTIVPHQAIRIMTGALIPAGLDAVIRLEDAEIQNHALVIRQPLRRGQFIQHRGAEVRPATILCRAGERLTPQRIGMALALGLSEAEVVRTPRIAFVAPGDELLPPGAPLQPGKKWCSNLYALNVRARELGYQNHNLGIVPDTAEALIASLQEGLSLSNSSSNSPSGSRASDAIVILGASGQGDHDFAGRAMAEVGAVPLFRGVAMAPGRSTAVAQCRQTLIFGLPGSPWATFITFELFVRPALDAMLGQSVDRSTKAVLTSELQMRRGVNHVFPVRLQPRQSGLEALPLRDLLAVAKVETDSLGMLVTPSNRRRLPAGMTVRVLRI